MRVWLAAFWIVGIAAAPAQAAFELRPHRLGNVSWMPRLEEPFSPRGPVTEPGWSTGWLHASHQGASDVSLDAIAVARSGSSSWGVRVARLGTAHYSEWMTQASLRPFPHLSLAIEHLTSGGDAAFRELGIRSYSAVTLSAAAQRALGRRVRLEIAGNDWVRGGPTEKLGIVPALDLRGDLRIGRGVSLGFGRSWWFAEGKRSGSTFGVSWTPHPHLSLGQSITDGSGLTHWLSF
ncbi:MAG: hypothetical protein KC729_06910, partial [Candidatus Eisenbacteria bacterium]|nr:hypothetical protein [Candidatus Eisenbacteria bacterium]